MWMDGKMTNAKSWSMVSGKTTEYKIDEEIWVKKDAATIKKKAGRPPDIKKYIKKNYPKNSIFKLDDYYQKFPQHRQHNKKFEKSISEMIAEKKLQQLNNKELKVS